MDLVVDDGVSAPEPVSAPENVPAPAADPARSAKIDTWLSIGIWVAGVTLVLFAGYFAYTVYAQAQAARLASPALQVIDALQKQVDAAPKDPTLRSRLAEALGTAGLLDQATSQLIIAVKLDPTFAGGYENLGAIAMTEKNYADAEKYFNKVLELTATGDYQNVNQRRDEAYFYLGEIALIQKRYVDAVGYFNAAIRVRKDASDSYLRLGQAYVGLGEKDQAKEQFNIALTFDPHYAEAHFELGKLLLSEGDKVNAAWEFRAALDAMPDQPDPQAALDAMGTYEEWYAAAAKAWAAGDSSTALDDVRIARSMRPDSFEAAMLNGQILDKKRDFAGAAAAYAIAFKIDSSSKEATMAFARSQEASRAAGVK
jgi:Flp pilus assembly protein TadD